MTMAFVGAVWAVHGARAHTGPSKTANSGLGTLECMLRCYAHTHAHRNHRTHISFWEWGCTRVRQSDLSVRAARALWRNDKRIDLCSARRYIDCRARFVGQNEGNTYGFYPSFWLFRTIVWLSMHRPPILIIVWSEIWCTDLLFGLLRCCDIRHHKSDK